KCDEAICKKSTYDNVLYNTGVGKWNFAKIVPVEGLHFLIIFVTTEIEAMNHLILDDFFSSNLDVMVITTGDGVFLKVNDEFTSMLGYPFAELEHNNFLAYVQSDDVAFTQESIECMSGNACTVCF